MSSTRVSVVAITLRSVVVHTVTYIIVGILAYNLFDYASLFTEPGYSGFMRPTDDPLVTAAPDLPSSIFPRGGVG